MPIATSVSDIRPQEVVLGKVKGGRTPSRLPVYYRGGSLVFKTPYLQISHIRGESGTTILQTVFSGSSEDKLHQFLETVEGLEQNVGNQFVQMAPQLGIRGRMEMKKLVKNTQGAEELYIQWPVRESCQYTTASGAPYYREDLAVGDYVRLIVKVQNFWLQAGECGLTVNVPKIMVCPSSEAGEEYDFGSDDEMPAVEDDRDLVSVLSAATVSLPPPAERGERSSLKSALRSDTPRSGEKSVQWSSPPGREGCETDQLLQLDLGFDGDESSSDFILDD